MVPKLPMRPVLRAGGCLALVTCRVFDYLRAGLLRSNIATPARISPYRYDNYRPRTCSPPPNSPPPPPTGIWTTQGSVSCR